MFSFAIARRQLSVFLVFKSSKWVVNCSKQSQKVLENQEFPGFDSVLPWQINITFIGFIVISFLSFARAQCGGQAVEFFDHIVDGFGIAGIVPIDDN